MLERIVESLFKYRPLLFQEGELAFSAPPLWLAAAGAALAVAVVATYLTVRGRARGRDRLGLGALRLALLAVVLVLLMRPVLLISTVVPQENYLAVLVDDSRSMRIDDGVSRAGVVHDALLDPASPLLASLADQFRVRLYRFSDGATRMTGEGAAELEFSGDRTRLGRSLEQVRDELGSLPLSGVVVVTDGADQAAGELDQALLGYRAAGVPVFPVGVGSETLGRDIELTAVNVPSSALGGAALVAEAVLSHSGFGGRTVQVLVERDGRIVGSREVELEDETGTTVRVDFSAGPLGPATYRVRVPVQEGERVDQNNERDVTITVQPGPRKVLYYEGEPRHEVAFLRRAVAPDSALQVVVLQRTDDQRFMRLGVDSGEELASGFPRTREELFQYRALVLGSVEASAFSHEQLEMIEEFVERRGGGLLMLGGRSALSEGGWAGTPVARALPVELLPAPSSESGAARPASDDPFTSGGFRAELTVEPTRSARRHPITRMEEDAPVIPWAELPALSAFNRVGPAKPGATALLVGRGSVADGQVVLAEQRYGRGRSAVFAVHDSWIWQMDAGIPLEDQTHERLWRQLLRWLVAETPDAVATEVPSERIGTGDVVPVTARVRDPRFGGVNDASVVARVTSPAGGVREVPLRLRAGSDGEYGGQFPVEETGLHEVRVEAAYDTVTAVAEPAAVRAGPDMSEYFGAAMHRPLLERVASETGGRFYTAGNLGSLPEDLAYTARGATVVEEKELWDMPAAFLVVLMLMSAEWLLRRRKGLA